MTDRELMQQALRYMESIGEMDTYPEDWAIAIALRERLAQPEQEPVAWVYPEGLEALKSGRPWTAYGSNGGGRIPLYLNDAVAPKAEPRSGESGAGFESLPASPQWQGLTNDEIDTLYEAHHNQYGECKVVGYGYERAIEAKLKAKNA